MSWYPLGRATSGRERLVIAILIGSLGTLGFSITAPLLPDLAQVLDVSTAAIGVVQAAVSVPGILFSGLIGYLADRFGRRPVVLVSLLLFSTLGVAGFVTRSFWGLVAVRFVQGVGTSGILGMGIVLISDFYTGRERTRALGFNLAGLTVMSMAGPSFSGLVASGGTFRPFLIFGIGYPLALWASRLPRDDRTAVDTSARRHMADAARSMRKEGTLVDFVGVLIATVGAVVVLHGLGLTTTSLLLDLEFGTPVEIRGLVIATFQIGVIVASIRIASIKQRLGPGSAITIGFALMSAGSLVAAVAPAPAAVGTGLILAGAGFGLFIPLAQEYSAGATSALYRGITVLTWVTVVRVGQVVGPPFGSVVTDVWGPRATFVLASAGMAGLAISWRAVRRRAHRR